MTQPLQDGLTDAIMADYQNNTNTDIREGNWNDSSELPKFPEPQQPPIEVLDKMRYIEDLSRYKSYIPFNKLWKPKEILRTHPMTVPKPYSKIINEEERLEAQRTRPRLIISPATSLDDVEDQEKRNIIMRDMYTTEMKASQREATLRLGNQDFKAPLPDHPAPANPLVLPPLKPPYVSKEWRMDSLSWDRRQLRSFCDVTKTFWLLPENAPSSCNACNESAVIINHRRKMQKLKQMQ